MKFLSSPATLDQFDTSGLFKSPDGRYFNYLVEYNENEDLRITDSVGRIMPIDYTEIKDFAVLLTAILEFQAAKEAFDEDNLADLFDTLNLG